MASREAQIAARKAKGRARIEALQQERRRLDAQQHAIERRRYQLRLVQVGQLAAAAGLLDWPDAVLETAFRRVAEQKGGTHAIDDIS